MLADIGLGFVFLLAGYELDLRLFREDAGRRALLAWFVSLGLALGVVGILAATGLVRAFLPVALGLTTTALGTLLPVLREKGLLGGRLGRYLLATGGVGELFPVLAIAVFLGSQGRVAALASLAAVAVLAVVLGVLRRGVRGGQPARGRRGGGAGRDRADHPARHGAAAGRAHRDHRAVPPRRGARRLPRRVVLR